MSPIDPLLELLGRAMELPDGQREAFLHEQCVDDPALLERALPLIQEEEKNESREWDLSSSRDLIAPVLEGPPHPLLGQQIGPWKLSRVLGEGGMGTVYMGDRMDEAFSQEVAVKVIREGITHSQTLNRFHQERQIQAALDHPAIAALIDAGHTRSGQPFFVMEYVPGVRIDDHCEAHDLDARQRVQLMQETCIAVQYLHGKGIVHRDLKPSNLMVQPNGKTKLLDFGVAQVLNQTAITSKALPFVTPAYASPESLRDGSASPASDQYSIAIILYELLTDRRPTSKQSTIPSARGEAPQIDFTRLHRGALARISPRDPFMRNLRAVLARALNDDPSKRYASVEDLRLDLQRLTDSQPVLALGRSRWQKTKSSVRAHRLPIAASLLFIGTLVAILIQTEGTIRVRQSALAQSQKSRQAAESHAKTMEHFAKEILLGLEGRLSMVPEASKIRERSLSMGTALFDEGPWSGPLPKRLLNTLIESYWKLGTLRMVSIGRGGTHIEGARASFRKAIELAPILGETDPRSTNIKLARSEGDLGSLETEQLRLEQGGELLRSSLLRYESDAATISKGALSRAYLRTLINLALNEFGKGNQEGAKQALGRFEAAFQTARQLFGKEDPLFQGTAKSFHCNVGILWHELGDLESAQHYLDLVLSNDWSHPQDFPGSQPTLSLGQTSALELQWRVQAPGPTRGDLDTVESLLLGADESNLDRLINPPFVARLHRLRALMLLDRDRREESLESYRRNFKILRYALRQDPNNLAWRDTLSLSLIDCAEAFSGHGLSPSQAESMIHEARGHLELLHANGADAPSIQRLILEIDSSLLAPKKPEVR